MKIYTRGGDSGQTDLFGGERVSKNHYQVKAYGDVDCANTAIGMAASMPDISPWLKDELHNIMRWLFCAGAELATAPKKSARDLLEKRLDNHINDEHVLSLENSIDKVESRLVPLKSFILPCGSQTAASLHFARNLVRKSEISLLDAKFAGLDIRPEIMRFFNRLSDYLFVLARLANVEAGVDDLNWSGRLDSI